MNFPWKIIQKISKNHPCTNSFIQKSWLEFFFELQKFSPIFIFIFLILFFEQNTKKSDEIFENISFVDMKSSKIN
jgi:hypothetical protein